MEYVLVSGAAEAQGRRETMEDTHIAMDEVTTGLGDAAPFKKLAFYGVYDGHGGTNTAILVEKLLHNNIFETDQFKAGDIPGAIDFGFGVTDRTIVEQSNEEGWMNGSTAVTAVVADGKLFVGNIGDSEACLVSLDEKGELATMNLTTPHKASDPSEKERIEGLGGHVFFGRVFGALAVSRAFGDSRYKQPKTSQDFVTAEPAQISVNLAPEHKFLILACDGLWDVMDHKTAAEIVHRFYQFLLNPTIYSLSHHSSLTPKEGKSPSEVARLLVTEALRLRTEDNVTVAVVYINWNDEGSSSESDDEDAESGEETVDLPSPTKEAPSEPENTPSPAENPTNETQEAGAEEADA